MVLFFARHAVVDIFMAYFPKIHQQFWKSQIKDTFQDEFGGCGCEKIFVRAD